MIRKILPVLPLAAGLILTAAPMAAHASPQPVTHAVTHVTDRPDSGNGGDWADDSMTRTLTITRTGGVPGAYTYTAKLADSGSFTTIKGALTPNQGGSYAGDTIGSKVTGTFTGTADFTFTATTLPRTSLNAGVPLTENDHGNTPADSTSTWYELAFPAGTVFGGPGIGDWGWTYKVTVTKTVTLRVCVSAHLCWSTTGSQPEHQQWVDSSSNADGNLQADGNITG